MGRGEERDRPSRFGWGVRISLSTLSEDTGESGGRRITGGSSGSPEDIVLCPSTPGEGKEVSEG